MDENVIKEYCFIIKNKVFQQRFESALDDAMRLKRYFPNNEVGHYYCALCEFALQNFEKAQKHYKDAIKINPAFAKAYFNL